MENLQLPAILVALLWTCTLLALRFPKPDTSTTRATTPAASKRIIPCLTLLPTLLLTHTADLCVTCPPKPLGPFLQTCLLVTPACTVMWSYSVPDAGLCLCYTLQGSNQAISPASQGPWEYQPPLQHLYHKIIPFACVPWIITEETISRFNCYSYFCVANTCDCLSSR